MDPSDGTDQLLLFYQHFNGSIMFSQLLENVWQASALGSGNVLDVQNAANGTSLGGTSYMLDNVLTVSMLGCRQFDECPPILLNVDSGVCFILITSRPFRMSTRIT